MKRSFFTLIALVAVAAGCTKSGLVESPQTYEEAITFEPYTGKAPITKAAVMDESTLKAAESSNGGFHVVGFIETDTAEGEEGNNLNRIDSGDPYLYRNVIWNSTDSKWGYQNAAFWPEGKQLTFVAFGLNGAPAFTDATEDYTKLAFTVNSTVASQKDLVISPKITDMDGDKVVVQLYHVLSKVGFKIETKGLAGSTASVKATVKNIRLKGNFKTGGTFDLTNAVISGNPVSYTEAGTPTTGSVDYSLFDSEYELNATTGTNLPCFVTDGTNKVFDVYANATFNAGSSYTEPTATSTDASNRYMMIMPQTVQNATIEVVYQLTGGIEQKAEIPLNQTFDPGKAYEFQFTISTVAVDFNVIVNDWTTQEIPAEPLNPVE